MLHLCIILVNTLRRWMLTNKSWIVYYKSYSSTAAKGKYHCWDSARRSTIANLKQARMCLIVFHSLWTKTKYMPKLNSRYCKSTKTACLTWSWLALQCWPVFCHGRWQLSNNTRRAPTMTIWNIWSCSYWLMGYSTRRNKLIKYLGNAKAYPSVWL